MRILLDQKDAVMAMMTPFRWDYRVAGPLSRKRRKKPFLGIDPGLAEQDRTTQQSFTDFPINTVRGRGGPDNRHRDEEPVAALAGGWWRHYRPVR